jgi:D-glycero-D-manno-heptose 1,7-bisphosphate phosphatase
MPRTALFVEIPGVLIAAWAPDLLLPNVGLALRRLRQREVPVIAVTDRAPVEADEFPEFAERLRLAVVAEGGALAGIYAALPDKPASWRKPRPGMLLSAARELQVDLPTSWLVGTEHADVHAAAQAGLAGAVLVEGVDPPAGDLGIVVATARDLADAPRVMIPRSGGCWHDHTPR